MKTVILYATKTNTTEKCARKLKEKLKQTDMINIKQKNQIDFNACERVIIGTPIRMGLIDKEMKMFLWKNIEILKEKELAFFICCAFTNHIDQYLKENIPSQLLDRAIIVDTFGGELEESKQKGFDKVIVKIVTKSNPNQEVKILEDHIEKFASKLEEKA